MAKTKSSVTPAQLKKLDAVKRQSTVQLLFVVARLLNEKAIARVQAAAGGRPVFKASHAALLPHLDYDGVRVTTLAERLGISKQAVSQMLAEMAAAGTVELLADPEDGRAKLARLTAFGAEAIAHGLGVLLALEKDLAAEIGAKRLAELRRAVLAALAALPRLA